MLMGKGFVKIEVLCCFLGTNACAVNMEVDIDMTVLY